jgi:hypothetical protein
MDERTVMALMRENAALSILEAEVIVALKYYDVNSEQGLVGQIQKIRETLAAIEAVRGRENA